MCYNIKTKSNIHELEKQFHAIYQDTQTSFDYNMVSGFAHPKIPVIESEEPSKIHLMKWGLIPPWVKDEAQAKDMSNKTLNAMGETVFTKPSFRSIMKRRCLILVDGFYEWQHTENNKKIKYLIELKEPEPFALGGLYDEWINRNTGEVTKGFSIITVPANPLMEVIHNVKKRMPLILKKEDELKWIDTRLSKEQVAAMILPYDEHEMVAEVA